jgi:hypothetical protein
MATRKAVAASLASALIFSSLIVSNFAIYSGAAENFRLVSLSTEERAYEAQATLIAGLSMLDLIDGAQQLLSSGHFGCSNATESVAQAIGSEVVRLDEGGLHSYATLSLAPDEDAADPFALLNRFNGSLRGMTDVEAAVLVQGTAPDGSVRYYDPAQHLLNLPLRLRSLTEHCVDAEAELSAALTGLGDRMCNSTALAELAPQVVAAVSESASADGFALSVSYFISSAQPCRLSYWIMAQQQSVRGPEGAFAFTEEESGYLEA